MTTLRKIVDLPIYTNKRTLPAGEIIGVHRAVVAIGNQWRYADPDNLAHAPLRVYLTLASGLVGTDVQALTHGEHTEAGWNWTSGYRIFLGPGGTLSDTLDPTRAYTRVLAVADSSTHIYYDPRPAVIRSH